MKITVWISKYALTSGITKHVCYPPKEGHNYVFPGEPFACYTSFVLGVDAHTSLEEANIAAEKLRLAEIDYLKKKLAEMEQKRFVGA